jgi:CheY-like chemotaxis protein
VVNLVRNAVEALPESGGTITLSTRTVMMDAAQGRARGLPPGRYTLLQVEDTGCGMGPDVLAHLFEPFFTTKPFGKGAGLGLAVVQGLVRQYRGNITVQSEVGRGSRFTVFFPVLTTRSDALTAPPAVAEPVQHTVLVVEDDPGVSDLLREVLERANYTVLTAASAKEALDRFQQHADKIQLLLSDVDLPDRSGVELARQIRQQRPGLPLALMSGYPESFIPDRETLPADVPVLPKPLRLDALLAKVRELLQGKTEPTPKKR